tara:strand:- start:450 stop:1385 length:936 start_codon:yes stop_codon:yes gene_type:complete
MKNILLLGGNGFIGKNLLNLMDSHDLENNFGIYMTSSTSESLCMDNLEKYKIFNFQLSEVDKIKNIISENKISIILHLVSSLIPSSDKNDYEQDLKNVVLPSLNLFSYAADNEIKIIFISSGGTVYKDSNFPHKEDDALEAISYYGKSKIILENNLRQLKEEKNLRYLILRPSNVYGNGWNANSSQGLIPNVINNIINKEPITIWGNGLIKRDYLFVDDLSNAIVSFLESDDLDGVFNVGSSFIYTVLDVIKKIEKKLNVPTKKIFYDSRDVDVSCNILDITKIKEAIDFQPRNLDLGLDRIIDNINYQNE